MAKKQLDDIKELRKRIRHSTAHVMADVVTQMFPDTKLAIGPPTEDGFYYDFDVESPFTPDDLEIFEAKMAEVIDSDYKFERCVVTAEEARDLFADDHLKLERLEEFDEDEVISVYRDGPFLDLCLGPHMPSTAVSYTHLTLPTNREV